MRLEVLSRLLLCRNANPIFRAGAGGSHDGHRVNRGRDPQPQTFAPQQAELNRRRQRGTRESWRISHFGWKVLMSTFVGRVSD